jgi:toxin HigB-1
MIISFKNQGAEDIFDGKNTKASRKTLPTHLCKIATRKLDQLDSIKTIDELKVPPGNRFESLSGDREGEYSIRINQKYRVCFKWKNESPSEVEITDYH